MATATLRKNHTAKAAKLRLSVDFPRQNEVISSREYSLRMAAPEGVKSVEISLDQSEWKPCRPAVGYWWYDWAGYDSGEHEVVTRIETQEGRQVISEPHEFFVRLEP